MKSLVVHYRNKYPNGRVIATETSIDVYCAEGRYRVALRLNGAGQWLDHSEQMGAEDKHCQAPIPKDARAHKLYHQGPKGNRMGKAEEHDDRCKRAAKLAVDGRIKSIKEYESDGWKFDNEGNVLSAPPEPTKPEEPATPA